MTISVTSPVTGATMAGLTSPTVTWTVDTAPAANIKQWAATTLGGTQTGVTVHGVSSPFTFSAIRPVTYKGLGYVDPSKGVRGSVPKNVHKFITRKGVVPLAGNAAQIMIITTEISVPAGADVADPLSVKAALSAHLGELWAAASGIGDTCVTGIL